MAAVALDAARRKAVYFAQLAEHAEQYDEMAKHMKEVRALSPGEITAEEQRLISVSYSNTVSAWRASWRNISDVANQATRSGEKHLASLAFKYRDIVGHELNSICDRTPDDFIIPQLAMTNEEAVFYQKMKADTYRHAAELGGQSHCAKAEACRAAPSALRHLSSCGSISPRGPVPPSVVARRLCDLLLEFPEAAIGGVPWSTLLESYTKLYNDDASLGHETPSAAARALLAEVLRHQRTGQALGQVPGDQRNPIVAIDDLVALTPLPGFAGSWPAVYTALCALVRSCGTDDAEEGKKLGSPGRILLMSKLRPLLDSVKEGSPEETPAFASAAQAQSLLLSQLRPVSKWGKESSAENGLSFRGEDGSLRKLQKLGHVVKAVLQWRGQRLLWRQTTGAQPTAVDQVLIPKLELVFSKRLNNLVLCLNDTLDDFDIWTVPDNLAAHQVASHVDQHTSKPSEQRPSDIYENPFKWQPLPETIDSRIARVARPFGQHYRCYSSPSMSSSFVADWSLPKDNSNAGEAGETIGAKHYEGLHMEAHNQWVHPIRRIASPMVSRRSMRSRSREGRSPSCMVRARSVDREDSHEDKNLCREAAEVRSTSEPPKRQCWADIVDGPDELPLFNIFTASPQASHEASRGLILAQSAMCRPEEMGDNSVSGSAIHKDSVPSGHLQKCTSPKCDVIWDAHGQRTSSCGVRSLSCSARTRSLTRGRGVIRREAADSEAVSQEALEQRCTSEPPHTRWVSVFDDPFEPPHTLLEDVPWGTLAGCPDLCNQDFLKTPMGEAMTATTSAASPPSPPLTPEPFYLQQFSAGKRWSSPKRLDRSDVVMERATRSTGRARSLIRSHKGAMHRESSTSTDRCNTAEPRCTSEPAHYRWSDVYDDPFEPPPQGSWQPDRAGVMSSLLGQAAPPRVNTPLLVHSLNQYVSACMVGSSDADVPLAPCDESDVRPALEKAIRNMSANGQFAVFSVICGPTRARSLTRMSRSESQQVSSSLRRQAEATGVRCTSEPPQHRIDCVFDDPFEPPPQETCWSTQGPAPPVLVFPSSSCYQAFPMRGAPQTFALPFLL